MINVFVLDLIYRSKPILPSQIRSEILQPNSKTTASILCEPSPSSCNIFGHETPYYSLAKLVLTTRSLTAGMDSDPSSPSEAMAALMGFSSFGAAPKPKKRKYNPAVENAVTDASLTLQEKKQQEQQHKDYRPSSGASGGNRVPLGKGRVMGKGETNEGRSLGVVVQPHGGMLDEGTTAGGLATGKAAERGDGVGTGGLGESESASEDDGPRYVDTSSTPPAEEGRITALGSGGWGDNGARYVDTSRQPPVRGPGDVPLPAAEMSLNVDGGAGLQHGQDPNARSILASEERGGGKDKAGVASGELYDWRALRKGVVNLIGDVTYYDESFVENPWRELLGGG